VIVKTPFRIEKETKKCFYTEHGYKYLKYEIGKPFLKSSTQYPYIELVMVDANEDTLREELSKWFTDKAYQVWKMEN
jgi:hypothetical protein